MKFLKKFGLTSLLALAVLLSACSSNKPAEENKDAKEDTKTTEQAENKDSGQEKVLTIGSSYVYSSCDPHKDWNGWELVKLGVGETLFDLADDYSLRGKLVEDYKNIDPTTWEITLKDGLKFSNGKDVTGEAVIKSLERTIAENPEAASMEGTEFTADGNKITIKTKEANGKALNSLVDPHFIICDVDDTKDFDASPICTGPYQISEFKPENEITLVKNENYWNGTPKLDKIVNKLVSESTTLGLALESKEIDIAQVDTETADKLEADDNYQVVRTPSSRVYLIYVKDTAVSNPEVREGLFKAIYREEIADDLLKGGIKIVYSPFAPELPFAIGKDDVDTFDLEKSKELAEKTKPDSEKAYTMKFYERLNIPKIATQLQSQFTKAGWNVKAVQDENSKYVNSGDYDLGMYGVVTLRVGDPYEYLNAVFGSEGAANYNQYHNEKVDELLKQMKSEFDEDKRNELSKEILKTALADRMHYYIGNVKVDLAAQSYVKNFEVSPFEYRIISVDTDIEK